MRQKWNWLALALGGNLIAGCTAIIDVTGKQCDTSSECVSQKLGDSCVAHLCVESAAMGGGDAGATGMCIKDDECAAKTPRCMNGSCVSDEVAARWICAEDPTQYSSTTVKYSFHVLEFVSRKPPKNLTVRACAQNDVGCNPGLAQFEDTSGNGDVELDLPAGFLGYFSVRSSETLDALSYLTVPVREDTHDRDLQVVAPDTLKLLALTSGVEFDATKGLALVEAFDCSKMPAGGVHFTESRGVATPFYIVDRVPSKDATVSSFDMDNNVADGGFVNIPADFITFSAYLGVDGPLLGKVNAHVRANTVTFIDMYF
jgi:hypothetical protein